MVWDLQASLCRVWDVFPPSCVSASMAHSSWPRLGLGCWSQLKNGALSLSKADAQGLASGAKMITSTQAGPDVSSHVSSFGMAMSSMPVIWACIAMAWSIVESVEPSLPVPGKCYERGCNVVAIRSRRATEGLWGFSGFHRRQRRYFSSWWKLTFPQLGWFFASTHGVLLAGKLPHGFRKQAQSRCPTPVQSWQVASWIAWA